MRCRLRATARPAARRRWSGSTIRRCTGRRWPTRATTTGSIGPSIALARRWRAGTLPACGSVVIKTAENGICARSALGMTRVRHPFRGLGCGAAAPRAALLRPAALRAAAATGRPGLRRQRRRDRGAVLFPTSGTSTIRSWPRATCSSAAEARAAAFRFNARGRRNPARAGPGRRRHARGRHRDRRTGRGQRRRPAFLGGQPHGGGRGGDVGPHSGATAGSRLRAGAAGVISAAAPVSARTATSAATGAPTPATSC